ncbi:hypothetical protein D8674_015151 [Pyrus ussuriensis x Pyrus communis]|uniref:Uncharacterized protein n=1 Tax=Pyrus ussuriensis x Pyrus communis TaxID=2448454 RepID=A0A5N5GZS0_9ROSA|nr:hypothetical protein D8674_015151 [Pyrus ussuriensis x Pyrus communis]
MELNLDLFLVAFLHAAFIACVLLLVISVMLTSLLLAFAIGLVLILIDDMYNIFLCFSSYIETVVKHNLELGFVLIVYKLLYHVVAIFLVSKPFFECKISQIKVKARSAMNVIDGLRPS